MLNAIFAVLVLASVVTASYGGTMAEVTRAGVDGAKGGTTLALGLVGQMTLWLGFMSILEKAGLMRVIARGVKPVMTRLFPSVPPEHPAMSAMVLNIVANMLGLGNAATPFGLKAMVELDRLNDRPGVATDAMVLFLAINTSGVAVLPLGVIAGRAQLNAENLSGIMLPSMLATFCSTVVGIVVARFLQRRGAFDPSAYEASERREGFAIPGLNEAEAQAASDRPTSPWGLALAVAVAFALVVALGRRVSEGLGADEGLVDIVKDISGAWLLPMLMALIVLVGTSRGVRIYEVFIEGGKAGFRVGVMIIPYLVAILVAIGMFRASGAMDFVLAVLTPVTSVVGFPAEALPMALIRPLSGSGAYGVMMETMRTYGPDSFVGFAVSVMNGSTETTFYVLAVYYGAIGVRVVRHTLYACLAADVTGALMAVAMAKVFF